MYELVTVAAFQYVGEAELMQATLESHGIQAYLINDNIIAMDWLLSNAVGGVKLQVARKDVTEAEQIIQEFQCKQKKRRDIPGGQIPISFACENCGRSISFPSSRAGGVETCPRCGKYVDVPEVS